MGLHKRAQIDELLEEIAAGRHRQVYLCFGERFLSRQTMARIESAVLARHGGAVHDIDGTAEDTARLLARLLNLSLLPGRQLFRVVDTNLFHSQNVGAEIWDKAVTAHHQGRDQAAARHLGHLLALGSVDGVDEAPFSTIAPGRWTDLFGFPRPDQDLGWADRLGRGAAERRPPGEDAAGRLAAAIEDGLPAAHVLLLTAEQVDKRKKLFQLIKNHGEVIDCCVAEGGSRAARQDQDAVITEMIRSTLAGFGAAMEPAAVTMLIERVGAHPAAVVRETEKLALFADGRATISAADVSLLVGRTREDPIFELTEAVTGASVSGALTVLDHLLADAVHELAVLGALRNHYRRLLVFRALQDCEPPRWQNSMSSNEFQARYLPALKQNERWAGLVGGHPYAVYKGFQSAARWPLTSLQEAGDLILQAEFRIKGAPIPPRIVLDELLLSLMALNRRASRPAAADLSV